MAPIPDIRELVTYFAAEVMQLTIEYIEKTFGGDTPEELAIDLWSPLIYYLNHILGTFVNMLFYSS